MKILYHLFLNEKEKFGRCHELIEFQEALYYTCSLVGAQVREAEEIEPSDEHKSLLDSLKQFDVEKILETTNEKFFGEDGRKDYEFDDFKDLFTLSNKEDRFAFILTPKGIRYLLENTTIQ